MNNVILPTGEELVLDLVPLEGDDRLLGRDVVTLADLTLPRDETWREGIRVGKLAPTDPSECSMRVLARTDGDHGPMLGYAIELTSDGQTFRQPFSVRSLGPLARRRAAELLKSEALPLGTRYSYRLSSLPRPKSPQDNGDRPPDATKPAAGMATRVRRRVEPLALEEAPLADYLARSEVMPRETAPLEEEEERVPLPVFITDELWQQSFDLARRGGEHESAAVWTGRLMRDTQSPEVFVVVDAAIEAEHADESELSVTFSGDTWGHVRTILAQRRKRLKRPHERIVGAVHGHNFLPAANEAGERMCEACPTAKYCGRSTAGASVADFEWFAAVFCGQPWALSLIHGFNARGENDWRLYHLNDGCIEPRTLRRLKP